MSNEFGQPARHARVTSKGVFITASAVAAVAIVGAAYTLAAPPPGPAISASFVSSPVVSGTARLTAAGLNSLLNARFGPVRAAITGQGSTAAQQVAAMLTAGSGQLSPDGTALTLDVPAVANIDGSVAAALAPISSGMGDLGGSDGQLAQSVNGNVVRISPLLSLTGPNATVSATAPIDLAAAVAPQLDGTNGAGAVTLDPQSGTITIDLSKLLGSETTGDQTVPTLSPTDIAEIEADINAASASMGDNVVNTATNSVENTPVNVDANVKLLTTPTVSGDGSSCTSTGETPTTTPTAGGLLSGALGSTLNSILGGTVGQAVDGVLCSLPTQLLPALLTSLGLDVNGTVGQFVEGSAPAPTGSVTVLGSPAPLNGGGINTGIGNTLVNNLAGTTATGGSGQGTSGGSSTGSGGLDIGVNVNGNLGTGLGDLGLGNLGTGDLGLGGLLGSSGTGITPGILGSLLTNGSSSLPAGIGLPVGISASVGNGSAGTSAGSGTSSGSDLLDVTATAGGLNGSVKVGGSAPASGSSGSSGGSTTSTGSNLLNGLIHIGTPATGGTSGGQSLINLGF